MAAATEKTAEDIRRELQELQRQHREITERLRDPRGLRRGAPGPGPGPGAPRPLRGFARPAVGPESGDQPPQKRRLLSAVVKVDGAENNEEGTKDADAEGHGTGSSATEGSAGRGFNNGGFRRDGGLRMQRRVDYNSLPEPAPRELPRNEDPNLVRRNKRMLGQLLVGTLEKFQQEDKKLSNSEAFLRRSETQRKAEQKVREESERLRQKEREQIAEKRKRDMTLRARVAAKAEEKRLELLYIQWTEHHKRLSNFLRTKAEPPIYYMPTKPIIDDPAIVEQNKEKVFEEWKSMRRDELTRFQKQVEEQYLSNVERQLERIQNARNARKANGHANMQEMDKELDTHRAEHGPKTRRVPEEGGNDDDEDAEDMAAEDEVMDEVLGINDGINEDPSKPSEEATTEGGEPAPEEAQ
uniref:Pinin/SDK/memA/ protein conserved region containing protein n=1 Tax=Zea mays TaxID=4577 RepID=B6TFH8_MAIZE|nr:pinin/SDK/memA/ protein conserved region containing protein [Zea mays]